MSLLDDIKSKADANGDGKVSHDDLESLRNGDNGGLIDKLEAVADQNSDGKISLDDVKHFDLGTTLDDVKNRLF